MAKTKQDYYKQGADHFQEQLNAGNDVGASTLSYMGDSWQAKAFKLGYGDAYLVWAGNQGSPDDALNEIIRAQDKRTEELAQSARDSINAGDVVMPVEYEALQKSNALREQVDNVIVVSRVLPGREVCSKRARLLRRRHEVVRFSHYTENGKARYVWNKVI